MWIKGSMVPAVSLETVRQRGLQAAHDSDRSPVRMHGPFSGQPGPDLAGQRSVIPRAAIGGESTRNTDGGKSRDRDPVTGAHPVQVSVLSFPVNFTDPVRRDIKRGHLGHWHDQKIVLFKVRSEAPNDLSSEDLNSMDVHTGKMLTLLCVPDDGVLVHLWMLLDSGAEHACEMPRAQRLEYLVGT